MGTHPRPDDIDALYGLEPVLVPGEAGEGVEPMVDVQCPWCGEPTGLQLDLSTGSQSYIEDCQVCCAPMQVAVTVGDDGRLAGVEASRADR